MLARILTLWSAVLLPALAAAQGAAEPRRSVGPIWLWVVILVAIALVFFFGFTRSAPPKKGGPTQTP